jgi:replication factor C subunit 2/4
MWSEKYRPACLEEIVGQLHAIRVCKSLLSNQDCSVPHLIFYGPSGTGKTCTARLLISNFDMAAPPTTNATTTIATTTNVTADRVAGIESTLDTGDIVDSRDTGDSRDVRDRKNKIPILFLDAASDDQRGIEVVRQKIKPFVMKSHGTRGSITSWRFILIDHADMLTPDAQTALRRIMEVYHAARFILTCEYQARLIDPIISRCVTLHFAPLSSAVIEDRLLMICDREVFPGLPRDNLQSVCRDIARYSQGDLRHAILALECVSLVTQTREPIETDTSGSEMQNIVREYFNIIPEEAISDLMLVMLEPVNLSSLDTVTRCLARLKESGFMAEQIIYQFQAAFRKRTHPRDAAIDVLDAMATADFHVRLDCDPDLQLLAAFSRIIHRSTLFSQEERCEF